MEKNLTKSRKYNIIYITQFAAVKIRKKKDDENIDNKVQ